VRVAAIYDIHGNLPALEAVLDEIRQAGVDQIVVGGDVLPGPMPRETIDYLRRIEIPTHFIYGNGDRETLERMRGVETEWYRRSPEPWREPVRWNAEQLGADDEKLLASWPATMHLQIPGIGGVLFCHATPRNDTEIFTRVTSEDRLLPMFTDVNADIVVCGHTHMQFERTVGTTRVLNAGSVGMPFGKPGAYWLLLGTNAELQRTDYDVVKGAERIRRTGYPQAEEFAARNVLNPPSETQMLEAFSRVESK
jgi:predicted phosphodiesterase